MPLIAPVSSTTILENPSNLVNVFIDYRSVPLYFSSSYALETRHSLYGDPFESKNPKWRNGVERGTQRVSWIVRGQDPAVKDFHLAPGAKQEFILDITLSPGEYDIVFGYGDMIPHSSQSAASNMVALDVAPDGTVTLPKVEGR